LAISLPSLRYHQAADPQFHKWTAPTARPFHLCATVNPICKGWEDTESRRSSGVVFGRKAFVYACME
jgi:hypothetical protein